MLDCGSPYNLISQDIIAWNRVLGDGDEILPVEDLNGNGIQLYQRHRLAVLIMGKDDSPTFDAVTVFGAVYYQGRWSSHCILATKTTQKSQSAMKKLEDRYDHLDGKSQSIRSKNPAFFTSDIAPIFFLLLAMVASRARSPRQPPFSTRGLAIRRSRHPRHQIPSIRRTCEEKSRRRGTCSSEGYGGRSTAGVTMAGDKIAEDRTGNDRASAEVGGGAGGEERE